MQRVGLGGSCFWCTEGIFRSVIGVFDVQQGWISASPPNEPFSEAILFNFDPAVIALHDLIAIHLHSHSCTSAHSMRKKYRSAIYVFDEAQKIESQAVIKELQMEFEDKILTDVLDFAEFKLNIKEQQDYYHKNQDLPFCRTYIEPKLRSLMERYSGLFDSEKTVR